MAKFSRICVICQNPFTTFHLHTKACSPQCGAALAVRNGRGPKGQNTYLSFKSEEDAFWSRVDCSNIDGCWEWTGPLNSRGYGVFRFHGKTSQAHRSSYLLAHKTIPAGMFICHSCDNPPCVNPNHLWAGTHLDNMRDKVEKGRQMGKGRHKNVSPKIKEKPVRQVSELLPYGKKINPEIAKEIRELYATRKYSYPMLANLFNVHKTMIGKVVRYQTWNFE